MSNQKLDKVFRRTLLKVIKWAVIIAVAAISGTYIGLKVAIPQVEKKLTPEGSTITTDSQGDDTLVYEDKVIPKSLAEEMTSHPDKLIAEQQQRTAENPNPGGDISGRDRRQLTRLGTMFLRRWETFNAGELQVDYTARLAPYTLRADLDTIAARTDAQQPDAIGLDGSSGSALIRQHPGLRVLRFDGTSATVSFNATVRYTGPDMTWSGIIVVRSYTLVCRRTPQGWRIARAVGRTIEQVDN